MMNLQTAFRIPDPRHPHTSTASTSNSTKTPAEAWDFQDAEAEYLREHACSDLHSVPCPGGGTAQSLTYARTHTHTLTYTHD